MAEQYSRDFKGIWIPKEVWLCEDLSLVEKIMLVEINSLDNEDGCFASNEYFAKFFNLTTIRVSQIIGKLKESGYITLESFNGRQRVLKTCFKIYFKADLNDSLMQDERKFKGRIKENDKHIDTTNSKINNTNTLFNESKKDVNLFAIPDGWPVKEFTELWHNYVRNRKGKTLNEDMAAKRIKLLIDLSNGDWKTAKEILIKAAFKGWDDFTYCLPPKTETKTPKANYNKWK